MKKRMLFVLLVISMVLATALPTVVAQEQPTIVDIAVSDGRFTTLVAAVTATGLADALSGGEWTVFAPTDDAFAKLGLNANNVASAFSRAELTDILLYHALPAKVSSEEALTVLGDVVMANNQIAGLKYFDGSIYINDDSKVIIPDILASNGVIHVVDTVIIGPWPKDAAPAAPTASAPAATGNTIVDIAVADGRFSTLVAAVTATGLAPTLSGGEWTVFAPTDDAFAKLGLNASNVASAFSTAALTDILLYHVLPAKVSSEEALTVLGDVVMGNNQIAGLKYFDGSIYVNDNSKVIIPDVLATNGVIHVVDTVILGPWPKDATPAAPIASATSTTGNTIVDIAVTDGRFTTLVAAVTATGLADALSGGEWTVFAPTDDAFAKLGLNAGNVAGAFSTAELTDILLYHALPAKVSSEEALTLLGDVVMANNQIAGLKYFDGSIYVNDDSKVIIPDVLASNGVIHVVDTVILGPWPKDAAKDAPVVSTPVATSNSIVDIAVADGRFTTLVAAVTATGLAPALSGGEWTVFAPTDDAFAKLGLNASNVAGAFSTADLTDILLYHALPAKVSSEEALTVLGDVVMANNQIAGLKYFEGSIYVNDDSKVIIPNILADNGVIHVVDTVILGPWPR